MTEHQGQHANNTGKWFEEDIEYRLVRHGYLRYEGRPPGGELAPYFVRQERTLFRNLYGTSMKVDFYVWHPTKYPQGLILEAKYQERGGSVDEKFPFLIGSLKGTGVPALLILVGKGARKEALGWCLAQQDAVLSVMTTWEQFLYACNKGLL